MLLTEIKKAGNKLYYPAFLLEHGISHRWRKIWKEITFVLTVALGAVIAVSYGANHFLPNVPFNVPREALFPGLYLFFCLWILLAMFDAFYYSFYFTAPQDVQGLFIDFDLAYFIFRLQPNDIVLSFFKSKLGSKFILRANINPQALEEYLGKRSFVLTLSTCSCDTADNVLDIVDFVSGMYESDESFKKFLFSQGVQKKDLASILEWIMEIHKGRHALEAWWSAENLFKTQGVGQNFAYGKTYNIERYERIMPFYHTSSFGVRTSYGKEELNEMQAILAKSRGGNALLIGEDVSGGLQLVSSLNQMIVNGICLPELKRKRIIVLDSDALTSVNSTKAAFETEFVHLIGEALHAGNVILVIDNMPAFISSANSFGSDLATILEPYLASSQLQIIALSTNELFHHVLEKNAIIMQLFETVLIKEVDNQNTIKILENEVMPYEARGMYFTYASLVEIVEGATRYFPNAVMPDKAIDLLTEIVPKLSASGKKIVEKTDVQKLVELKTGIPVGAVGEAEKDKLMNLEKILQARIVGQEEAVSAISNAMRRARSGIENPNRPLGSFLFLGPTGVGKTETTKALADVFFGAENHILRLDMSEYSSVDSTSKLIGSFETNQAGILSSMLREHPYGVLLLDEFEKTTEKVMDLFLQILDEGFFSDGHGKKVMARNLIIIATSNAGSDMIWQAMQSGKDLAGEKDAIVDAIIGKQIFRPELLNRFDGVILFHPLGTVETRKIAELMLKRLKSRLAEKGINLIVDDTLINFVVSHGSDPKFGARPMNRVIQEKIEELVAEKIIKGEVLPGSDMTFTSEELG